MKHRLHVIRAFPGEGGWSGGEMGAGSLGIGSEI